MLGRICRHSDADAGAAKVGPLFAWIHEGGASLKGLMSSLLGVRVWLLSEGLDESWSWSILRQLQVLQRNTEYSVQVTKCHPSSIWIIFFIL